MLEERKRLEKQKLIFQIRLMYYLLYHYVISSIINLQHICIVLNNFHSFLQYQLFIQIFIFPFLTIHFLFLTPYCVQNCSPKHIPIIENIFQSELLLTKFVYQMFSNCYRASKNYVDVFSLLSLFPDCLLAFECFEFRVQDYCTSDLMWRSFEEFKAHENFVYCIKTHFLLLVLEF